MRKEGLKKAQLRNILSKENQIYAIKRYTELGRDLIDSSKSCSKCMPIKKYKSSPRFYGRKK